MWRGLAKGALLFAFGRVPGGAEAYRTITRDWMGTQATHADKLQRVWPEYAHAWRTLAGVDLDGADVWVHEGGWTPFPFFANYLVTGKAGVVTNVEARILDRYLARAVNAALACDLPPGDGSDAARATLEGLRWSRTAREAIATIGGKLYEGVAPARLPLADASVDLCHSAGVLEHVGPDTIAAFLRECRRVVRPGGVLSHVVDHRDHLHHADPDWPYLGHLRLSITSYRVLCGHQLLYHNRLLPGQVAELFERAGFERIAIRRRLSTGKYVDAEEEALAGAPGIARSKLAREFSAASDADLRTAAAHYIFRAPS